MSLDKYLSDLRNYHFVTGEIEETEIFYVAG